MLLRMAYWAASLLDAAGRHSRALGGSMRTSFFAGLTVIAVSILGASVASAQLRYDHVLVYRGKAQPVLPSGYMMDLPALQAEYGALGCEIKKRKRPKRVLVPVAKTNVTPIPPHTEVVGAELSTDYLCYKVKCQTEIAPAVAALEDQFLPWVVEKLKVKEVCIPVPVVGIPTTTTTTTTTSTTTTSTTTTTTTTLPAPMVFVTSGQYTGDWGGVAGADAICQAAGSAGSVTGPLGATWVAWISDSTSDARDRVADSPYYTTNGTFVVSGMSDLTDGSIAVPIDRDENGNQVTSAVWTGTRVDGTAHSWHCGDWTGTDPAGGRNGYNGESDASWTEHAAWVCGSTWHIYCFQQ